ncbi:MAG TPA: delta-60 repeat domain-containing protein, partial [Flavobacteriales bacterium]|nr:delta-60 repeat domain-containing protein [Flavobacteriales bacterium]
GKIVAAGRSFITGAGYRAVVLRFNANGTIDNTFGTNGIRFDDIAAGNEDCYYGVAVQADGKIVAGGLAKSSSDFDVAVARYNVNGTLDATYGTNGIAILDIGGAAPCSCSPMARWCWPGRMATPRSIAITSWCASPRPACPMPLSARMAP